MDIWKKKTTAIVLAAGKGSRMRRETPKQYLLLRGRPVLFYSLYAFEQSKVGEIVLVCAAGEEDYCRESVVERYGLSKVTRIVPGGKERCDSVRAGLEAACGADYVLIHDGARPLVTPELIDRAIDAVRETKACVVGVPVKDTVWVAEENGTLREAPPRAGLWSAQTPQCFDAAAIREAYRLAAAANDAGLTDDAAVAKKYGGMEIRFLPGSYRNLKITTPEDLTVAEALLNEDRSSE